MENFTFSLSVSHKIHVRDAVKEAIGIAHKLTLNVEFAYKGIMILVSPDSDISEVVDGYEDKVAQIMHMLEMRNRKD